jgi:hypothetical protein
MKKTAPEWARELSAALEELKGNPDQDVELFCHALYTVHPLLAEHIGKLEKHVASPTEESRKSAGTLLEQVAFLAFSSLNGYHDVSSFRSAPSQHDLLLSGDGVATAAFCSLTRVDPSARGILVECKAEEKAKLGDQQMRRLCAMLADHFPKTVGLGVFVTLRGATGYEKPGREVHKLGAARLTQTLFYARTARPIVVLDLHDIRTLTNPASLPLLLKLRVADLERMGATRSAEEVLRPSMDELLPEHLRMFREG